MAILRANSAVPLMNARVYKLELPGAYHRLIQVHGDWWSYYEAKPGMVLPCVETCLGLSMLRGQLIIIIIITSLNGCCHRDADHDLVRCSLLPTLQERRLRSLFAVARHAGLWIRSKL